MGDRLGGGCVTLDTEVLLDGLVKKEIKDISVIGDFEFSLSYPDEETENVTLVRSVWKAPQEVDRLLIPLGDVENGGIPHHGLVYPAIRFTFRNCKKQLVKLTLKVPKPGNNEPDPDDPPFYLTTTENHTFILDDDTDVTTGEFLKPLFTGGRKTLKCSVDTGSRVFIEKIEYPDLGTTTTDLCGLMVTDKTWAQIIYDTHPDDATILDNVRNLRPHLDRDGKIDISGFCEAVGAWRTPRVPAVHEDLGPIRTLGLRVLEHVIFTNGVATGDIKYQAAVNKLSDNILKVGASQDRIPPIIVPAEDQLYNVRVSQLQQQAVVRQLIAAGLQPVQLTIAQRFQESLRNQTVQIQNLQAINVPAGDQLQNVQELQQQQDDAVAELITAGLQPAQLAIAQTLQDSLKDQTTQIQNLQEAYSAIN